MVCKQKNKTFVVLYMSEWDSNSISNIDAIDGTCFREIQKQIN